MNIGQIFSIHNPREKEAILGKSEDCQSGQKRSYWLFTSIACCVVLGDLEAQTPAGELSEQAVDKSAGPLWGGIDQARNR